MNKRIFKSSKILAMISFASLIFMYQCIFFDNNHHGPNNSNYLARETVTSLEEQEITTKDGVSIYIPVDAVPPTEEGEKGSLDFTISKVKLDDPYVLDSGMVLSGDVYKFGPSGIVFAEPIQITMPINEEIEGNDFFFYRIDSLTGELEQYPAIIDTVNNTVSTYAYEFSQWMIALMKYDYDRRTRYGPGKVRFTNLMQVPVNVSMVQEALKWPGAPKYGANSYLYIPAAGTKGRKNYVEWILPQGSYEVCMQWKDGHHTSSATKTYYATHVFALNRPLSVGGVASVVIDNNGSVGSCSSKPKWAPLKPKTDNNNNTTNNETGTMKDPRDGSVYKTVKIGNQIWLAENLKFFSRYSVNGIDEESYDEPLSYLYGVEEYMSLDELEKNVNYKTYGVLYNWPLAQKVCPSGWRLPSAMDWVELTDNVGGKNKSGAALKEEGTVHWKQPNTGANNSSGFTALPGGFAYTTASTGNQFAQMTEVGAWWSSTESSVSEAYRRDLSYNQTDMGEHAITKMHGYSVRCVKNPVVGETMIDSRDGTEYKIVKIGNQVWMAENLAYIPFDEDLDYLTYMANSQEISQQQKKYYVYEFYYPHRRVVFEEPNFQIYGVLYNWYAAENACPAGWHLPSNDEWKKLADECGGKEQSGKMLKATGNEFWLPYITPGNNSTGFSALPGGIVDAYDKRFEAIGMNGNWWTSTEYGDVSAYGKTSAVKRDFSYNQTDMGEHSMGKTFGLSVRCVKD